MISKGTCYWYVNDEFYIIDPGDVALMNKGSCHYHNYDPTVQRTNYHIIFNDDYIDYYFACTGSVYSKRCCRIAPFSWTIVPPET